MQSFISVKPGTLLSPVPAVLVTCARPGEKPNAITIAWAGTVNSDPPMCSVSVRPERYSHGIISDTGEFVINLCDEKMLPALDLCGVRSGADCDKFVLAGLTPIAAQGMDNAPCAAQSPLYMACKVHEVLRLGSHDMFIGKVVGMGVREDLMDRSGKIDLMRADLIAYSHGVYQALGGALGYYGYSVSAPDVLERRMKELGVR